MSTITKVAVAGATGNIGPAIVDQLVKAGFQVTVLSRGNNAASFPSAVTVRAVDYDSVDSLTEVLKGQDALVSALAEGVIDKHIPLVKAAAKAQLKHFIPSEFGANLENENTVQLPFYKDRVAILRRVRDYATSNGLTYTSISNGPFLDWGIMVGFIMNVKEKSIDLYDGGNRPFSTATLATIGKAVAGVLKNPEATTNRTVYVQDTVITLRQLLEMGKKATGPEGWKENVVAIDEVLNQSLAQLKKDNPEPVMFAYNFNKVAIWGDGYGALFEKPDNDLLGIEQMSDADVQAIVDSYAK